MGAAKPASKIVEGPGREGRRRIFILDAPAELPLQLRDQRRERAKHRISILVFRFEMRADVRRQGGSILKHLAPIGRFEPIIRIADNITVMRNLTRTRRDRRRFWPPIDERRVHSENLAPVLGRGFGSPIS